jgi:cytochrome P450
MTSEAELLRYPPPFASYGMSTEVYDSFRKREPVCRVLLPSGLTVWLVTAYKDIEYVHKSSNFSRDEAVRRNHTLTEDKGMEVMDGVLQNMDGARHKSLRAIFSPYYLPRNKKEWNTVFEESCHRALDRLVGRTELDLRKDYFEVAGRDAARSLFGFPVQDGERILELFFDSELAQSLRTKIEQGLDGENPIRTPYFEHLRAARSRGEITTEEVIANLLVFCTVTFEAIGGPFLGGLFGLLRDKAKWLECAKDPAIVPNAVEEMLRCFPNGDGQFLRVALEEDSLSGVTIAPGDTVMAPVSAANTDPAVFPDPRVFDVRRANAGKNLAFSVGPHHCMGWAIGKAFMEQALAAALKRLEAPELAVSPDDIRYRHTALISIMEELPVKAKVLPRQAADS